MGMIGVELAARPPFLVVWVFWVQRLCVQSCISPPIGFRRAFARRSAAVSRVGTQRSWYGTY